MTGTGGVEAVLFDCWGTLFTNEPTAGHTVPMYAIADAFDRRVDADFRDAYETAFMLERHEDYADPVRRLAASVGVAPSDETVERVVDHLRSLNETQVAYDDAEPALSRLRERGLALGLVTNTDVASLARLRRDYPLDETFDAVVPSYEVAALKPHPAIFETALDRVGAPAERAAMVGDSPGSDVRAAEQLGLRGVLVDRNGRYPGHERRVTGLAALPDRL